MIITYSKGEIEYWDWFMTALPFVNDNEAGPSSWLTTSYKWSVFAYWVKNVSAGKSVKTDID